MSKRDPAQNKLAGTIIILLLVAGLGILLFNMTDEAVPRTGSMTSSDKDASNKPELLPEEGPNFYNTSIACYRFKDAMEAMYAGTLTGWDLIAELGEVQSIAFGGERSIDSASLYVYQMARESDIGEFSSALDLLTGACAAAGY